MLVSGIPHRTIWVDDHDKLCIIDQTTLPHAFEVLQLETLGQVATAISEMQVRGAGLIGATAAYGMWVAARSGPSGREDFQKWMHASAQTLAATRPTAVNLVWALMRQELKWRGLSQADAIVATRQEAELIADQDAESCRRLGEHGLAIIQEIAAAKNNGPVHILTHCNAGWLAFVDHGSALSPIYAACAAGIDVHVWVDETRPRNQGAGLTAWELGAQGVEHDLISDNTGGHLMQHGLVDMVITGADRVTLGGDVANKIGTYLKALAAKDNNIPFYVALPSSTFDLAIKDGLRDITIEERDPGEVRFITGLNDQGQLQQVLICPESTSARNWAFDITPARLVTGLITERGVCSASEDGIRGLFGDLL